MARDSKISVGVLNIAMHAPHSTKRYNHLFAEAYARKIQVSVRGDQYLLIGALDVIEEGHPDKGLVGEFYRYSGLDSDQPWFNISNREEATAEELKKIQIPEHLKPHFSRFPFVFFPKGHRLYIDLKKYGKTTSPGVVANALQKLFNDNGLNQYGKVEVTVQPAHDALQKIFNIPSIRTLTINLVRPNPDDHGSFQARLLKKLEDQNAEVMNIKLVSRENDLSPSQETKNIAEVAAQNGHVVASGKDSEGLQITRSTKAIPLIESAIYDSDLQTSNEVLMQTALKIHPTITRHESPH